MSVADGAGAATATPVAELDLPSFEFADASLVGERFHAVMEDLRSRSWLARVEPVGYVVLDREAVAHFMRSPSATFPGRVMLEVHGIVDGPMYERTKGNIMDLNGEPHRRLRRLVQPAFTPQAADRWRPAMRRHLESLFEPVAAGARCDFVDAVAKPYPARIIAELLGAPAEDVPRLEEWANLLQASFDPIRLATERDRLERANVEFDEYSWELLRARRESPGDDLLSELIAAQEEGDRLSDAECVHLIGAVLVGGVDTTQAQLAHGIRLFAERPEQWRALAEDPSLVPAAVEELLRFEPITPFTARIALEEIEYRGVTFPEGTIVVAAAVTANRDPAEYDDPGAFDVTAERGREKPLTFGAGPHFRLGANLARAELQEALAYLAPRMPGLEPDGEPEYETPFGVYGLGRLPVRWSA
ncbi:MAG TPA: cytochrome P450 [Thermoleophilaceae bacterium]